MIDPPDYYERIKYKPRPEDADVCRVCHGAKFVRYERPVGHLMFGKYAQCPRWSEATQNCVPAEPVAARLPYRPDDA
jgi:hypothetical protein